MKTIHEYNEIDDIRVFLNRYRNMDIVYIPNPGNAGDSLIAMGTIHVLDELCIKWRMGVFTNKYRGKILLYGGGGNLAQKHRCCELFLMNNKEHNSIVILPQTIHGIDSLLEQLGSNITIFCREMVTYEYVISIFNHKHNVYLSKDMAFYTDHGFNGLCIGVGICHAYRAGGSGGTGKTSSGITIPYDNVDISWLLTVSRNTSSIKKIESVTNNMLRCLSKYRVVYTDRLHVAIASYLLGKLVYLHPNGCFENKAVYDYSLYLDDNVRFIT
jgi:exopolysaccharide biosynthesis predicted pyruvyltransferase EpsI